MNYLEHVGGQGKAGGPKMMRAGEGPGGRDGGGPQINRFENI